MNEQGTIEALIAEYRADADMMDARELPLPTTGYLRILLNRVEAACRRAYKTCTNEDKEQPFVLWILPIKKGAGDD